MNTITLALSLLATPIAVQDTAETGLNSIGMKMIVVKPGTFLMGSAGIGMNYDEAPAHPVTISETFRISSTEVTNRQFEEFMPEHTAFRGKNGFSSGDDEAVIYVSHHEATAFCEWLSAKEGKTYRLPSEAEWEYACRAGSMGPYAIGDRSLPKSMLKHQEHSWMPVKASLEVGKSVPNEWGIYDMHGNVEEWCLDWYGPYEASPIVNPGGPEKGSFRVVRGGSHNTPVNYLRSANRSALMPGDRTMFTGFRVVEVSGEVGLNMSHTTMGKKVRAHSISQNKHRWKSCDKPFFAEPRNYIRTDSATPWMFSHNHCPAATWLPNGDIIAVWFSTEDEKGREMTILSSRLKAGTSEWTEPELFFKVPDRNMTGSALYYDATNGVLYHFNGVEAAGTWQNLACVFRTSTDNGRTWSEPQFVNAEHETGNQVIAGTIITSSGKILQPCDATPTVRGGSILHISDDGGNSWHRSDSGFVNVTPDFRNGGQGHRIAGIHAGVVELKDGRLLAFGRDNNIVHNRKPMMPQSVSDDGGYTWKYSASEFPPVSSGQRIVIKRLNEGAILLVSFTDARIDYQNIHGMEFIAGGRSFTGYGMFAAVSFDDGKTWPVKKLLTDGKERWLYGGGFTGYFRMDDTHAEPKGYLALTQSPDNIIHLFSSSLHYQFNLKWLTEPNNLE